MFTIITKASGAANSDRLIYELIAYHRFKRRNASRWKRKCRSTLEGMRPLLAAAHSRKRFHYRFNWRNKQATCTLANVFFNRSNGVVNNHRELRPRNRLQTSPRGAITPFDQVYESFYSSSTSLNSSQPIFSARSRRVEEHGGGVKLGGRRRAMKGVLSYARFPGQDSTRILRTSRCLFSTRRKG